MLLSSIYPPGVYFQEVEDTSRPAGRSGLAPTALIHVADDGEGIPPGQPGHIFERFYRRGAPPAVGTTAGPVSV